MQSFAFAVYKHLNIVIRVESFKSNANLNTKQKAFYIRGGGKSIKRFQSVKSNFRLNNGLQWPNKKIKSAKVVLKCANLFNLLLAPCW